MDTALLLRQKFDNCEDIDENEITTLLKKSRIVEKLTQNYEEKDLFNIEVNPLFRTKKT